METELEVTRIATLKSKPWNRDDFSVPSEIFDVPGMLTSQEKRMLYWLARDDFAGEGVIADMGTCLGGSAICFAAGLRERSFDRPTIHSYDLFKLGDYERQRFFPENPPPGLRTRRVFEDNLRGYLDLITVHEGDMLGESWDGEPIEILFVDIAKSYKVFDKLLLTFFPALIPSRSLIILQDYLWGGEGPWHHIVMEKLSDYCEYLVDTDTNSVLFLLRREIPRSVLKECQWLAIPKEEKLRLMDQAIDKVDTERKKAFLRESREHVVSGRDVWKGMNYHEL